MRVRHPLLLLVAFLISGGFYVGPPVILALVNAANNLSLSDEADEAYVEGEGDDEDYVDAVFADEPAAAPEPPAARSGDDQARAERLSAAGIRPRAAPERRRARRQRRDRTVAAVGRGGGPARGVDPTVRLLVWRGHLVSCNYTCGYCPFAKRKAELATLRRDREALDWSTTFIHAPRRQLFLLAGLSVLLHLRVTESVIRTTTSRAPDAPAPYSTFAPA
jgi:hypothetical protein